MNTPAAPVPPSADDLAAQAVLLSDKDPLRVDVADIPKPPAELVDELDNSGAAPVAAETEAGEEAVTLDFVGDEPPHRTFQLRYPFRLEGRRIDSVTVRQLTTAEMGRIAGDMARAGRTSELYEIYAAMTGLPARVLRLLPAVDGGPIVDQAFDFLPPLFRPGDA